MKVTTLGIEVAKSIFQLHGGRQARQSRRAEAGVPQQVARDDSTAASVCDWDGSMRECAVLGLPVKPWAKN
jgi:hypothetical protein